MARKKILKIATKGIFKASKISRGRKKSRKRKR